MGTYTLIQHCYQVLEFFKYPHIQLTDTGGFILFIVKHKTGILKVKVYIEKVHLYHKALTT